MRFKNDSTTVEKETVEATSLRYLQRDG